MDKYANRPIRSAIAWTLVLLYTAIVLDILPFHQPWHDEAHFWLICRDTNPLSLVTRQVAYEGSPPLRYFLVMALAKAGMPYVSMGVLNALAAIATVAVLVFLSPFAMWQKAAITFSLYQVFMYGTVWRLYSLAVLLLLLVAWLFHSRFRRPLLYAICVSLLANTCLQMLGVSLLLLLEFVFTAARGGWKQRDYTAACVTMAASIAFAIYTLIQPADINVGGVFPIFYKPAMLEILSAPFVFGLYDDPFIRDSSWNLAVVVFCISAFLLLCWNLRSNARALGLVVLTLLGWSYIFTFKNTPSLYHEGLMLYVVLAALWITKEEPAAPGSEAGATRPPIGTWILFAAQGLTVIGAAQTIALEVAEPFSGARDAARYLSQANNRQVIAEYTHEKDESLLPYLPGRLFWHIEEKRFGTYKIFRDYPAIKDTEMLMRIIRQDCPVPRPWLLVSSELDDPRPFGYMLIYRSPKPAWGYTKEAFWLYCPIADEHPPAETGLENATTLGHGHAYRPFDAKFLLESVF